MEQSYPTIESLVGKVVELANGSRSIVVNHKDKPIIFINGWLELTSFDDKLQRHGYSQDHTIMKVYEPALRVDIMDSVDDADKIIWQREPEVKEVTMAEVEEKFGCKVKIIK